jgi:CPA1 family monovalent cation:H+ antiporter
VLVFGLVVVVTLIATVILGTVLGGRYRVAPPVLLIVFGALLGLIPRFGGIRLDGQIVLLLFLPAILYWESLNISLREVRANLRIIVLRSVVLVIVAAATVSLTAQALGVGSHAAWVLGAVLAPTDAAAVAGLAKRLPRRTLTTLRAESIINDGTALVLFAITVAVATGGTALSPAALVGRFVGSYAGGIAAGLLVGMAVTLLRRRLDSPLEEGALSVLTPFAAFLLAQSIHTSGVVAVLVAGATAAPARCTGTEPWPTTPRAAACSATCPS